MAQISKMMPPGMLEQAGGMCEILTCPLIFVCKGMGGIQQMMQQMGMGGAGGGMPDMGKMQEMMASMGMGGGGGPSGPGGGGPAPRGARAVKKKK